MNRCIMKISRKIVDLYHRAFLYAIRFAFVMSFVMFIYAKTVLPFLFKEKKYLLSDMANEGGWI